MATWDQIKARVLADLDAEVQGNELHIVMSRTSDGAVREQAVLVTRYAAWGREMIELRSAFGEAGSYAVEGLLEQNLTLPLGAIARHGNFLVLVHKACLSDLTVDGVLFLIDRVGATADTLEARTGGDQY